MVEYHPESHSITSLDHITRPPGRVSSPPPPDHHSITALEQSLYQRGRVPQSSFTGPITLPRGRVSPSSFTRPITLPTWPSPTIIVHSTNHSSYRSSPTIIVHSTNHSTNMVESHHHHSLDQSLNYHGRVPPSLFTRPITRPHGSSNILNLSQYCVVLSTRVSEYFAISSMYFTFSRTRLNLNFYLVLFRRHCVLDLL